MIVLTTKYPSQAAADGVNYPLAGKARNVVASGDNTGTPLEKDWMNDLFGWQQALMAQASLTPNGAVETQIASQLLQAIQSIVLQRTIASYRLTVGTRKNNGQNFPITLIHQFGGYAISGSDSVIVPAAGKYKVGFNGCFDASSVTNPTFLAASLRVNAVDTTASGAVWRYSATASDVVSLSAETVLDITTPASQPISATSLTAAMECAPGTFGTLILERVA